MGRVDEDAVVLALNLVEPVAQGLEEQIVGLDDLASGGEFNDRVRAVDGLHQGRQLTHLVCILHCQNPGTKQGRYC